MLSACAGNALICVYLHKVVFGMAGGVVTIVGHLVIETEKLVFVVGRHTAVCREAYLPFPDDGPVQSLTPCRNVLVDYLNDMNDQQKETFRQEAMIPEGVSLEFEDFETFYNARKDLLTQKIRELLG